MTVVKIHSYPIRYALKKPLAFSTYRFLCATIFIFLYFSLPTRLSAQSIESLYQQARNLAANQRYDTAIILMKQVCEKQPLDTDMRLYLARVYAWKKDFDNAQYTTSLILYNQPRNQDALLLLADIYLWSKQWDKLEKLIKNVLYTDGTSRGNREGVLDSKFQIPDSMRGVWNLKSGIWNLDSIPFIQKYAFGLIEQKRYQEAEKLVFPVRDRLFATWDFVKSKLISNTFSVHYTNYHFNTKQSDWHVIETQYAKKLSFATIIGSVNYANRFEKEGFQFMAQAYPKIGHRSYAWLLVGVSDGKTYPNLVYGGSFFTTVKKYWELEAGIRFFKVKTTEKATILRGGIAYQNKQHRLSYTLMKMNGTGISGFAHVFSYQNYFNKDDSYIRFGIGTGSNNEASLLALRYDNFIINSLSTGVALNYQFNRNWAVLGGCSWEHNKNQGTDNKQSRWVFDVRLAYKF